jgi:hypothetical protein
LNQTELDRAAKSHPKGKLYLLNDTSTLAEDVPEVERVTLNPNRPPYPLWNHPVVFTLGLWLFIAEWILRKRRHLL